MSTLRGMPALLQQQQQQHRHELVRRSSSSAHAHASRKCKRMPCIRCTARAEEPHSWTEEDASQRSDGDSFAGWSFIDSGSSKKNSSKLPGFLKVGAGIALAVGFGLVSHAATKKGFVSFVAPAAVVQQEPSACGAAESVTQWEPQEQQEDVELVEEALEAAGDASQHEADLDACTTGQVSLPADKFGDKDFSSSAFATGAASTLGLDGNQLDAGEGLSTAGDGLTVTDESSSVDAVAHELESSSAGAEAPLSTSAEPESPTYESSVESPSSDEPSPPASEVPLPETKYAVSVFVSDLSAPEKHDSSVEAAGVPEVVPAVDEVDVFVSTTMSERLSQEEVSPKVAASPVETVDDLSDVKIDSIADFWKTEPWHIPAPSTPVLITPGRMLVPPVVDYAQEHSLSALQSLKVVEPGVRAADICTRREYARWLVTANRLFARSTATKVLPAMYIEKATELAFSDVTPEDPDFPYIQGLAEAGLIASKLSGESNDYVEFSPDSPLTRQDLVSWKLALSQRGLRHVDLNKLLERTGFFDIEQIHKDALPTIAADVAAGDRGIIATAFGYTRRFQPHKPVTKGQAAVALASGDTSEQLLEELDRIEAERLAEKAVAAEIALEARMQEESNEAFREQLESEKQATAVAESLARALKAEVESLKGEKEKDQLAVLKEKASIDAAKESVAQTRVELDTVMQEVTLERVKVVFERERLDKLLAEIEEERSTMEKLRSEMEVETKALVLARAWAEEEAKKARAHAKVLEAARKRWQAQGIEVHVDEELEEVSIPVPSWQYNEAKPEVKSRAPVLVKVGESRDKSMRMLKAAMHSSGQILSNTQQRLLSSVQRIGSKAEAVRNSTFFVVSSKATEVQTAAAARAEQMQRAASSLLSSVFTVLSENSNKLADGCRGKLAQIFKP